MLELWTVCDSSIYNSSLFFHEYEDLELRNDTWKLSGLHIYHWRSTVVHVAADKMK